jgi:hypothetical protein
LTTEATQKSLKTVCLSDAPYLGERLAGHKPAGVLSVQPYLEEDDYDGVPLCFSAPGGDVVVVGKVTIDWHSIKYVSGSAAAAALGDVIGPDQATEFTGAAGAVYFHALKLSEYYGSEGMPQEAVDTPELTADGVTKSLAEPVDLEKLPTKVLHQAFQALEAKYTPGVPAAEQAQKQGREIFAVLQKRVPGLASTSPLLRDPTPTEPAKPFLSRIVKNADTADPDWMYVLSMVLEPNDGKDGADLNPDFDGEIYDRHLIRKMAYPYVAKYRGLGIMHEGEAVTDDIARVVQCYVVDDGFTLTDDTGKEWGPGSWFLGAEVKRSSDLGQRIESGEIGAWSIDGIALKIPEKVAA